MVLKHLVPALLATLVLGSCATKPLITEPTTVNADIADVHLELTYLDRDTLIDRHGSNREKKQNPFVDYPGIMPRKNIIVLDTVITTEESSIIFKIAEIRLEIADKSGKAVSIPYLRNLWLAYQDIGWSRIEVATRENMFDKEFGVDPQNPATGYLVFPYNYGIEGGRGMISMILYTPNGDRGILDIPIIVSEAGMQLLDGSEESGIFAEDDEDTAQ